MNTVEPAISGPKRPQDRILLKEASNAFNAMITEQRGGDAKSAPVADADYTMNDGDVVIAAITSCTNTSNPYVMIGAGLVLQKHLDEMGYDLVGYGCTTCIGNSGPLPEPISAAINAEDLVACSVLSGNRNFEGRVNPDVRANYLASPPLVVAYSILGTMTEDITTVALGQDQDGNDVFLKDIWPTAQEIAELVEKTVTREAFQSQYADVFTGDEKWAGIETEGGETYGWPAGSTYVQNPPYFEGITPDVGEIKNVDKARVLALLADSITTDHISPARGTFANIRIRNQMAPGTEGGVTRHVPSGEVMPIFDAAMKYADEGTPLVVVAGKEYGTGSSRDWAAKGTALLGVKAVIAESFERIHRSNLVGMGVIPLEFTGIVSIAGLEGEMEPRATVKATIEFASGETKEIDLLCRIDTAVEIDYVKNGGVLHYVLRDLAMEDAKVAAE